MKNVHVLIAMIAFTITSTGYAAGFDCSMARTLVEESICSDPELSDLDEQLNGAYYSAINTNSRSVSAAIKKRQRVWLSKVRNSCRDVGCLKRVYRKRLGELHNLQNEE